LATVALRLARDTSNISASKKALAPFFAEALKQAIRQAGDLHQAGEDRPLLNRLWFWLVSFP
jgi:hypothetical protein